jgi:hypothetical protein
VIIKSRAVSVCRQIKHSQLEHTDRNKPCCRPIGLQGNENADETDRNKLRCICLPANTKHGRLKQAVRNESYSIGLQGNKNTVGWNQMAAKAVQCRSAGEHKTASWDKLDRTNETSYCFLLLPIITSQIKGQ